MPSIMAIRTVPRGCSSPAEAADAVAAEQARGFSMTSAVPKQPPARGPQHQPGTRPLEQLRSHGQLELRDAPADGGVIQIQAAGGLRQAAGDLEEDPQVIPVQDVAAVDARPHGSRGDDFVRRVAICGIGKAAHRC